jgi:hypothetical protein
MQPARLCLRGQAGQRGLQTFGHVAGAAGQFHRAAVEAGEALQLLKPASMRALSAAMTAARRDIHAAWGRKAAAG